MFCKHTHQFTGGMVHWQRPWSYPQSYCTSGLVSIGMGDRLGWPNHVNTQPATRANSASYPTWDGKWVSARVQWGSVAGE